MTIRDIAVAFGYEVDERSVSHAENTIKNIKGMATKLLGAIGIGFSIVGMASLAEAAADAEALKSQFSQTFREMESEASDRLDQISEDTGIMVNRMKGSFSQITAFAKTTGMETSDALDLADRSMMAVADSAAYYDRSLEDVTNSLRSFLKGNFENDAALGLSCTETTRNAAANELYGKSFKDLSEAEKQLTLLSMVENANKASGALGQAARESDTWTNQLGNLKQSVQDLKAAAGAGFLKPAVAVLKLLSSLVQSATRGIQKATGETGNMTRAFDSLFALVKKLKPSIDRMMQTLSIGASKGIDAIKGGVEKLGGIENAVKIVAVAAGTFFAVMEISKITSIIKKAGGLAGAISKVGKSFSAAKLQVLGIIAVIVMLALIIEDFINFMQGNDSVIGSLFEKAGVDCDKFRENVRKIWENLKTALTAIWQGIKGTAIPIFQGIWNVIKTVFEAIGKILEKIAPSFANLIEQLANGNVDTEKWKELGSAITKLAAIILGVVAAAKTFAAIQAVVNAVMAASPITWIIMGIIALIAVIVLLAQNWDKVKEAAGAAWEVITTTVGNIKQSIVNGIQSAIDWIKGLPSQALQWGADIITGIADGIKGAISKVTDAVSGVADKIKSFLHFSVPDEGPLTDFQSWMPDFMSGLASGIGENEDTVLDKVRGLASGISTLMKAATASATTAAGGAVNNTSNTTNVTQNNTFNNSYSGNDTQAQKNVSKGMNKSAQDATSYMAKGLAYAR